MGVSYRLTNIIYFTSLWLRVVNMLVHSISQTFPYRDKCALGLKHLNFYFINFKTEKAESHLLYR
jgi:hypothetical protein